MIHRFGHILTTIFVVMVGAVACAPDSDNYTMNHYLCDFEGAYWDALVDNNPNGDNLLSGTIATEWHDKSTDLKGGVSDPYQGWWEGIALSNYCSKDLERDGTAVKQLVAYVDTPYSGKNFAIYNAFSGAPVELRFESKRSYIESMMIANTTYSRNATANGYGPESEPLGKNESIWIEAQGFINGSNEVQATATFYLYKNGKPSFEGWKKWYMTSMCKVDKIQIVIKWNRGGACQYPAYFAIDDINVVRRELIK